MSASVSLRMSGLLEPVGRRASTCTGWTGSFVVASRIAVLARWAVARDELGGIGTDRVHERRRDAVGHLDVGRPQPPGAVDGAAPLHDRDLHAGEGEQVTALRSDLLGPVVAGGVPGDPLVGRPGKSWSRGASAWRAIRYSEMS